MARWTRRCVVGAFASLSLMPLAVKAQAIQASPPMWRVRGKVGTATLFGQMPVRSNTPWQTEQVMSAFESSGTLWLENPVFSPAEMQALAKSLASKPRLSTSQFLPADDLRRLHAQLARAGLSANAFDETPADNLYQQLGGLADQQSGADFSRLPERVFRQRAAGKSIETEWHSLAEVTGFIPAAPDPLRLQLIRLGLDDFDLNWQFDERLAAWLSGDALYFDRLGAIIAHRLPQLTDKMSGERNRRLASRLAAAMERRGSHFVCVGIRHVSGPDSLQTALANLGLTVERV